MAELKTKQTTASVKDFIAKVPDEQMRKDSKVIIDMMKIATGEEPKMWGPAIIGFGNMKLTSGASGKEIDWFRIGFSPRKANLSLYLSGNLRSHAAALKKLGKHKTGASCLYIRHLADVDVKVLKSMIDAVNG
jgi:hypothetical protein